MFGGVWMGLLGGEGVVGRGSRGNMLELIEWTTLTGQNRQVLFTTSVDLHPFGM